MLIRQAEPIELTPGTMNVDELMRGIDAIREGFTQPELYDMARAMNEEYIESEDNSG